MSRLFVSYRREDTGGHAGRLFDKLEDHFGADQVFIDVELEPGVDYVEHIQETISTCDALIVMIGPRWTTIEGPGGERRLDDPDDLVRTEVATALRTEGVTAIPVLVQGAVMPQPHQLPPPIRALARRNALEISDSRFEYDSTRLIEALERRGVAQRDSHAAAGQATDQASAKNPRLRLSRRSRLRLAVVAALLALLLCLSLFLFLPKKVIVPEVTGAKSSFEAEKMLTEAKLKLDPVLKQKVSTEAPPGTVIGQTPSAGEKAKQGSQVAIETAIGGTKRSVPDVVGAKSAFAAEKALRKAGFRLAPGIEHSVGTKVPAGTVVSQTPTAGEKAPKGAEVAIRVAVGTR